MHLAPVEAIGNVFLVLPNCSHSFLHTQRVGKLAHLLEFVDADNDVATLAVRDDFGQRKHLFRLVGLWCDTQ